MDKVIVTIKDLITIFLMCVGVAYLFEMLVRALKYGARVIKRVRLDIYTRNLARNSQPFDLREQCDECGHGARLLHILERVATNKGSKDNAGN